MRKVFMAFLLSALGFAALASPQGIVFILDASNSMNKALQGTPKIQWAKDALIQLIQELPEDQPFGLLVFGHRVPKDREAESCRDVEIVVPLDVHGKVEREQLISLVQGIEAKGKTPLSYTLSLIGEKLPTPCRVVLLTDGQETCGLDPTVVAERLAAAGCTVDVLGLGVGAEEERALRALTLAGHGRYWPVEELPNLLQTLKQAVATKPQAPAAPQEAIPPELQGYKVDPSIVRLLLKHLPYPSTSPMWCVILRFLEANPPTKVIVGSDGDDTLFGTPGNDLVLGLRGKDKILGFGGNDLLIGGPGTDLIQGGDGADLILGGDGADVLLGGQGDDVIYGEGDSDRIEGEAGNDRLFGGPCNDTILGGPGCNTIDGGPGSNFVYDEGRCGPCPAPCSKAKVVDEGCCIKLRANVVDPDGDAVSIIWSATAGTFSDPHAFETIWCAPMVSDCRGEDVTITVTAVDACGAENRASITVHVRNVNHPPIVDAGPDLEVDEGGAIRLQASASDPDGDPLTYTWIVRCGRGSLDDPHTLSPVYTAPLTSRCEGEYVTLALVVRDACGAVAQDTVVVHIRNVNHAPWVDAGPDLQVRAGDSIKLCAKAGDPDNEPLRVIWSAPQGSFSDPHSPSPIFTAPAFCGCGERVIPVRVKVIDPCGAVAEDEILIRVIPVNHPPEVEIEDPS